MTVANKVAQTLASCEGAAANLRTFALETQNEQAKQVYQQLALNMDNTVTQLRSRLDFMTSKKFKAPFPSRARERVKNSRRFLPFNPTKAP